MHKNERWFNSFLFLFVLFLVVSLTTYIIDSDSFIYTVVTSATKLFLLLSILMNLLIINKTKTWRKNGNTITKEVGLKRIILLETNLISRPETKVYEIHHTPAPFNYGFTLRKQKRSELMKQLKEELKEDYEKLYLWKMKSADNILFITTTHPAMAHIWKETGKNHFYMKKMEKSLDPFVKMNIFQWISSSFSTTGRVSFKSPQQWDSYYFYTTNSEVKKADE